MSSVSLSHNTLWNIVLFFSFGENDNFAQHQVSLNEHFISQNNVIYFASISGIFAKRQTGNPLQGSVYHKSFEIQPILVGIS
jgi:hypothetical protein